MPASPERPLLPHLAASPSRGKADLEDRVVALAIEDDDIDAKALRRALRGRGGAAEWMQLERVKTLDQGLERLAEGGVDVLLLDLSLPDSKGVEGLRRVRELDARIPIVIFTGSDDEETALEALQSGGQDYIVKDDLTAPLLKRSLRYAMERKRMEQETAAVQARLLEVQKHEGLASLASGIAHDFNNLLTVVLGNSELVYRALPEHSPERNTLGAVTRAARAASGLTDQLLAYTGNRAVRREQVDLSGLVSGLKSVLERMLDDGISLKTQLAEELPAVEGDPTQLQQLLMNLVANAVEAMENGGAVRVSTGWEDLDGAQAGALIGGPGEPGSPGETRRYVVLQIRDTGCGIGDGDRDRIFDPFYSSKFPGRGLGLAACLGIARGHGGGFRIETEAGAGSCFSVYLPAGEERTEAPRLPTVPEEDPGAAHILVVDDEPAIRELVEAMLERAGYAVTLAEGGARALEILREGESIDLVILDLTMPGMSGERTYREIQALGVPLPVVLMSGYDAFQVLERFQGTKPPPLLRKPFSDEELSAFVTEALAARGLDGRARS